MSWTCKLGFPVQGVFPGPDLTDVNAVCRSNNRQILASGEDTSLVKIFKFPCTVEGAQFKEYKAHSSHVTKVRFTNGDNMMISTGGNDKTVLVWNTDFGHDAPVEEPPDAGSDELEEFGEEDDDDLEEDSDEEEDFGLTRTKEEI